MRARTAVALGPALALAGCFAAAPIHSTSLFDRLMTPPAAGGADIVRVDVALLEAPPGDRFLAEELWGLVDDEVIEPEGRAVLDDNGFRLAQTGGVLPQGLRERLTSARTCPDPRRLEIHAGRPATLLLGPPRQGSDYEVCRGGNKSAVRHTPAQFSLVVTASPARDGRVCLHFTPEVQTGAPRLKYGPNDDRSGWQFREDSPADRYPDLGWEATLAPDEFLVIGARSDRPGTLGHACFFRTDEKPPKQRVLVVRAGVVGTTTAAGDGSSPAAPPLALQATWPAAKPVRRD